MLVRRKGGLFDDIWSWVGLLHFVLERKGAAVEAARLSFVIAGDICKIFLFIFEIG